MAVRERELCSAFRPTKKKNNPPNTTSAIPHCFLLGKKGGGGRNAARDEREMQTRRFSFDTKEHAMNPPTENEGGKK